MRAIDCPACGQHAEAANDEELLKVARQHADQAHPDQHLTDDQLRTLLAQNAKDA